MRMSDTIVAGSANDFMRARHLSFRGPQRAIGGALAHIATGELGTDKGLAWADPETTKRQLQWLRSHWPAHYQRSMGVVDALGLDADDHRIDPSCLYYYWAVPGCSNAFWPGAMTANGHATLARNYDFTTGTVFELMGQSVPPEAKNATAAPFIVETYPDDPAEGYPTLCLTSYELLGSATDGINSEGLEVSLMSTVDVLRGPHNTATCTAGTWQKRGPSFSSRAVGPCVRQTTYRVTRYSMYRSAMSLWSASPSLPTPWTGLDQEPRWLTSERPPNRLPQTGPPAKDNMRPPALRAPCGMRSMISRQEHSRSTSTWASRLRASGAPPQPKSS